MSRRPLEQLRQLFGCHADAGVADDELDSAAPVGHPSYLHSDLACAISHMTTTKR
jgi:hypothetical protein